MLEWELLLIRLWDFGDQYLLPKLQNCSMRPLLEAMDEQSLAPRAVREVFQRTSQEAPVRSVITTQITGDLKGTYYRNQEIEEISQIPSLLVAVLDENRDCQGGLRKPCSCPNPCGKVTGREESYMVDEDCK